MSSLKLLGRSARYQPQLPTGTVLKQTFSTTSTRQTDFTHAVVGAGVVGLAIARRLAARGEPTILIEKHGSVGTETSSRNSEVIHAGLYYGHDSLKTRLCLRGKMLLYSLCLDQDIPHRRTGKWIVAQDDQQMGELTKLHEFCKSIAVPTSFLSREEISRREPDVRAEAGALESPTTGIIDSHSLMTYLEGSFLDHSGDLALSTTVTNIEPLTTSTSGSLPGSAGWSITTVPSSSPSTSAPTTITASNFINAAGLYAIPLSNTLLPPSRQIQPHYAKGTYYSYSSSHPRPSTLIYPAPIPHHAGLGTHLTLDLSGAIRFGPDIEWLPPVPPTHQSYTPNTSPTSRAAAIEMIKSYLPAIDVDAIHTDYTGIRPKLGRYGVATADFVIRNEDGFDGWVNLLGIESPGLTSCLAIAEEVEGLIYRRVE